MCIDDIDPVMHNRSYPAFRGKIYDIIELSLKIKLFPPLIKVWSFLPGYRGGKTFCFGFVAPPSCPLP